MPALIERLQGVVIENKDAFKLMAMSDAPDVLFYVDPPYVSSTRQVRQKKVYAFELDDDDHRRLAEVLNGLQGMVVLSGYSSDLYKELFSSWTMTTKKTFGEKAVPRTEVLWLNAAAVAHQNQKELAI